MPLTLTIDRNDPDYLYVLVRASDENASIATYIYVGQLNLEAVLPGLERFRTDVHGGLFDLKFGVFGQEYAGGALHVHLHFQTLGVINMTIRVQSEFVPFGKQDVASEATLYTQTSVAQLDNFARAMQAISDGFCDEAQL